MIDAVILDVGGVLVMPDHRLLLAIAAEHGADAGASEGALDLAHYRAIAAGEAGGGQFDWNAYRTTLLRAAGVPETGVADADAALAAALGQPARETWIRPLSGSADGFRRVAATGVPIAIVSNSDGTIAPLLADLGVCQVGAGAGAEVVIIVDSAVVGVEKPDPAIFGHAVAALGADPGRVVHVGDTVYADVVGATAAGVRPLHLDPLGWCDDHAHEHVTDLAGVADLVLAERAAQT